MARDNPVERGRAAYQARAWPEALRHLSEAAAEGDLGAEELWHLAVAAYLTGDEATFVDALERWHRRSLEEGRGDLAARAAVWLAFRLAERGDVGRASGWFTRAQRLLDEDGVERVEHGYLLIPQIQAALASGRLDDALRAAGRATDLAERFRDEDLHAFALHAQGVVLLRMGRVAEGLARLDEAMVAVASDELLPIMTGLIFCSAISACRNAYALRRAHEWTAALDAWCSEQPGLVPYAGLCLVYRAEVHLLHGAWSAALSEAVEAEERCRSGGDSDGVALALYAQGELHRLQGDVTAAEERFLAAARAGRDPQPGLALLRLAQGRRAAAEAAVRRALNESSGAMRRGRLIPALIEILLAGSDVEAAREACDELDAVARTFTPSMLDAVAAHRRGALELAAGDPAAALVALRAAWRGWQALDAPYEAARTRELVGRACERLQDLDTAAIELEAARAAYLELGAAGDAARLAAADSDAPHGLSRRELQVLRLVAAGASNKGVAAELGLSERTVERHLSNIYVKLDVGSRSAATAYAYEHGLA